MAEQAEQQREAQTAQKDDGNGNGADTPAKSSRGKFIGIAVVLFLIIAGGLYFWRSTFTVDTDDAQIDGDLFQVSSRIAGQVIKVYLEDNQKVTQGQLLAEIDPKDFQVALEQAQANLANAQAAYVQATVNVPITGINVNTLVSNSGSDVKGSAASVLQAQKQAEAAQARVDQAKANSVKAQLDVDRYTPLVQKDIISKQQFDAAVAAAAENKAAVLEAEAQVLSSQEQIRQAQQRLDQALS